MVLLSAALLAFTSPRVQAFTHPGIPLTIDDLNAVKGLVECEIGGGDLERGAALLGQYLPMLLQAGCYADVERHYTRLLEQAPYDLRLSVPALTTRDMILFGGIDDAQVTLEGSLIPFYRALKLAKAEKVSVVMFQTNHGFHSVRDALAAELIRWVGLTQE